MHPIKIIIDSGSEVSPAYVQKHGLIFMPMTYAFGEQVYTDDKGLTQSYSEFYQLLRQGNTSVTAQVAPNTVMETAKPYLQEGIDLLYLPLSSALSGTYQSALLAKEELALAFPQRRFCVVDCRTASVGLSLLLNHVLQMLESGAKMEEMVSWLEAHRDYVHLLFTVDDLNHLRRGGRISSAAAFAGTLLSIKPILQMNCGGQLILVDKMRGRRKALRSLAERMERLGENLSEQCVYIAHGDCPEEGAYLDQLIRQEYGIKNSEICSVGPIIGTHTGPDVMALAFFGKQKKET